MEMHGRTKPYMCGEPPTNMTLTATSDKEIPPAVIPYLGPNSGSLEKSVEDLKIGRFDASPEDNYDKPVLGLKPPHSKVGPSAGPDPYNVKSSSSWIDKHNTTVWPVVQPTGRGLDTSRTSWMNADPVDVINKLPSTTDRRSLSPIKKHPAVTSPTRERHAKRLQSVVPSDIRSMKGTRNWVQPTAPLGHTFKGSITVKDPFSR